MTDTRRPTPARRRERAERDERLARALRDNLQRRKEQSRARKRLPPGDPSAGGLSGAPVSHKSKRDDAG